MQHTAKEIAQEAIVNPKVAAGVAALATSSGLGTLIDILPTALGVVGSGLGIVLSSVLIWSHLKKTKAELAKFKAEERLAEEKRLSLKRRSSDTN